MENHNAETVKSELEGLAKFRTCPEYRDRGGHLFRGRKFKEDGTV